MSDDRPPERPPWFQRERRRAVDITAFILLAGLFLWLAYRGSARMGYNWQWYRLPAYLPHVVDGRLIWGPLVRGLMVTLEISLWAMILALALGLVVALLRLSPSFAGRAIAKGYLEIVRGTPLLVQLYLFYFILAPVLGIGRSWTGIVALACFEGAFASEILRAGILSVPKEQWEAATALDLTRRQSLRLVVLPQAVPLMLPPLAGVLVSLVKDSAIVSVIAIFDLTSEGRNIISDTFMSFEVWFAVAALYLAVTLSLTTSIRWLERWVGRSQGRMIIGQGRTS
jgi:polar amino acid transport system permease protein